MGDQFSLFDILERRVIPSVDGLLTPDQIYESTDQTLFVRLSEDTRFERKSSRIQPAGLAPCLSAFGNGPSIDGGVVAVGIDDKSKEIEGCKSLSDDRIQALEAFGQTYCPLGKYNVRRQRVINSRGEEDFILIYRMYYVPHRLVEMTNGDAYQRFGDKSSQLNDQRKHEIRIDKGERSFEQEPCSLAYPEEFRLPDIRAFCQLVRERRNSSEEISDEAILEASRLGRRVQSQFFPNNACALLFGRDPQKLFPGSYIRFLKYDGTDEQSGKTFNVIKDRVIEGTVRNVIKEAANVIDANLREFTEFKNGKFHSVQEYPEDAWYELLVNACVHRSYIIKNIPIFVKMFDDRIVFESPGGFMPGVTPETIYDRHNPRNPYIMAILRDTGEVKGINEGTKRVKREMEEAHLPDPVFIEKKGDAASVVATLFNNVRDRSNSLDNEAYTVLGHAVALFLTAEERKIINFTVANGKINSSDALRILATTRWHTAKKKLDALVERNILEYHSTKSRDPNAYYTLVIRDGNHHGNE